MKNLENLNLQELTIEEQVNTDGGIAPLLLYGLYAAGVAVFGAGVYVGYRSAEASNK